MTVVLTKPQSPSPASGLPSADRLLGHASVTALVARFGRTATLEAVRAILAEARAAIRSGDPVPGEAVLTSRIAAALDLLFAPSLKPVFNLTGTVLHTNLGRAVLTQDAAAAVAAILTQPSNLEFDLASGKRGDRDSHIESLICRLTGAEAATIVNNNAAAVLLVLNTIAAGKEVLISRGELVEIGGAFRIPDVMARAGARMKEVGHHQPDPSARLRGECGSQDRRRDEGPSEQLRNPRALRPRPLQASSPGSARRRTLS